MVEELTPEKVEKNQETTIASRKTPETIQDIDKKLTSKTFWPEKEQFFAERETHIDSELEKTIDLLRRHNFDEKHLQDMAKVMLRGYYVASYMLECSPIEIHAPVDITSNTKLPENIGGVCIPHFLLNNKKMTIDDYRGIRNEKRIGQLIKLENIDVHFNITRLQEELRHTDRMTSSFLKEYLDDKEEAEQYKKEEIEELAVGFEKTAIEEIAHAFYWLSVSKNEKKLKTALDELLDYEVPVPDNPKLSFLGAYGDYDYGKYDDTNIEKRASLWERLYLKKYYPDSRVCREALNARRAQKAREKH